MNKKRPRIAHFYKKKLFSSEPWTCILVEEEYRIKGP